MDHYEILGVSPTASDAVVRVAYRQRLKEVHPDTGKGDPAEFEAVLAAGAVLLEPAGRQGYDHRQALRHESRSKDGRGSLRLVAGGAVVGLTALALMILAPWSSTSDVADEVQGASLLSPSLLASADDSDAADGAPDDTAASAAIDAEADETEESVESATAEPTAEPAQIVALDEPAEDDAVEPVVDSDVDESEPELAEEEASEATADVEDDAANSDEAEVAGDDPATPDEPLPNLADLPDRGAIYRAPTLFLVGPVPSQEIADAFYAKAVAVLGEENVVNDYVVHPDAPTDLNGNVRVEQAITFATASAAIRAEFEPVLGLAFEVLTQNPQASLVIEGHTDSVGEAETNLILSQARAEAVVTWLAERGIERSRLSAVGYGEDQPVGDNLTEAGRSVNRRIEVQITDLLS